MNFPRPLNTNNMQRPTVTIAQDKEPEVKNVFYIVLVSKEQEKVKIDRNIIRMSKVINDAVDEVSVASQDAGQPDNDGTLEEDNVKWPEIPCMMVGIEELNRIKIYCEHFNFKKDFDDIPIPIP